MDFLSRVVKEFQALPDPLVFTLIAIGASGAVYSTVQHAKSWRPRKAKSVRLRGAEGKKIEDCTLRLEHGIMNDLTSSADFKESRSTGKECEL